MVRAMVRDKKGAALVEYSLLVAGVALIGAAAVSVFGHKTSDLMAAMAAVLPGAHADDNAPIVSGKLIETANNGTGIALDINTIVANAGQERLGINTGGVGQPNGAISTLVLEP